MVPLRGALIGLAALGVLGLLRYKPWQGQERPVNVAPAGQPAAGRQHLTIGYLPVT